MRSGLSPSRSVAPCARGPGRDGSASSLTEQRLTLICSAERSTPVQTDEGAVIVAIGTSDF